MIEENFEEINNEDNKKKISEEEYKNLRNMISEYFKLDEIIKEHNKKISEFKKNKTLIFTNIFSSMVENDIGVLETNEHILQLVNVKKTKSITEETLHNGILTSIREIDKTPEEYGINKIVDLLVNSINNQREIKETVELKIKKKKKEKQSKKNNNPKKSSIKKNNNFDDI